MIQTEMESNRQVFEADLPDIDQIDMQALDPQYAATNLKLGLGFTTGFLFFLLFAGLQPWFEWHENLRFGLSLGAAALIVIGLLSTLYHWRADPLKMYALREHDLSYQSGLIFRKKVTQPITRIQHIELKRGPIERKIGLATLQVFSAGGAMHTFEIPGLDLMKAQKLRQFILQHKDAVTHG